MSKYLGTAVFVAFFMILMLSCVSLYCQDNTPIYDQDGSNSIVKTIDGRVTSVDPQNFKISVKMVENLTFFVRPGTKITNSDGFSIELSSIKAENYVMVEYYDDKSGAHIARSINVEYAR
jgi:hypothetical protein